MDAEIRPTPLDDEQVLLAVEVFHMLADPTRVRLLWALLDAPSVSQHLAKLRLARLVRTRRVGTSVYYRIENQHIAQLVTDAVHNAEHAASDSPAHHRQPAALRRLHIGELHEERDAR
jgi:ArsR family transcriptional regulator, zinc-responsive transcriptional repressor